jgi:endonuclease YncB( thermonuclease family)
MDDQTYHFILSALTVFVLFVVFWIFDGRKRRDTEIEYQGRVPRVLEAEAVRVIDGDTVKLCYKDAWLTVRIHGIDAPEMKQYAKPNSGLWKWLGPAAPVGSISAKAFEQILGGEEVTCTIIDRDKYGRFVGTLSTNRTGDVGWAMVEGGWARAYIKYGGQRYARLEKLAAAGKMGIWAYDYCDPEDWRRGVR